MSPSLFSAEDLVIDFVNDHINYDRKNHRGKNELIAKALGINKGYTKVLDLTAGMGMDSVFLFKLGCDVIALERSLVIYEKLQQALQNASEHFSQIQKPGSLCFVHAEAMEYLHSLTERPQVIYYDPMYPHKTKSALPRKEMQIFRQIVGDDSDSEEVLRLALTKSQHRVVVKRPLHAEAILSPVSHSYEGKIVRFDMYQV